MAGAIYDPAKYLHSAAVTFASLICATRLIFVSTTWATKKMLSAVPINYCFIFKKLSWGYLEKGLFLARGYF